MYPESIHLHLTVAGLFSSLFLPLGTFNYISSFSLPLISSGVLAIPTLDTFSHTCWLV